MGPEVNDQCQRNAQFNDFRDRELPEESVAQLAWDEEQGTRAAAEISVEVRNCTIQIARLVTFAFLFC